MTNRIDSVTIVGGGTAGWITAMTLNKVLNATRDGPSVQITLIESPNVPRIGVGESTVPQLRQDLRNIWLINEANFFRRCNASFKLGVRFVNWQLDKSGKPYEYIHPFSTGESVAGKNPGYHVQKFGLPEGCSEICDGLVLNPTAIRNMRGPRGLDDGNFTSRSMGYAYHLDAMLLADFLRDVAVRRGVRHIRDDVVDLKQDERGFISHLQLKEGGQHPVEFVVDCTGFQGWIINKALGEPFEPYGNHLLCDRAAAVQIPHPDPTQLEPCTRSTALGAGWVWRVPLFSRVGTGYVFSSQFRSDQEAIDELMAHLGDQAKGLEPRVLAMRVGRSRRSWVKNCVAIGLSSGFIEPLEATGIFLIEVAALWLGQYFPNKEISPVLAAQYNKLMNRTYDEVRDFITMHYYTSNRTDPFWLAARSDSVLSDTLREKLELWRVKLPGTHDVKENVLFQHWNYLFVLYSKGFFDGVAFSQEGSVRQRDWERYCQRMAQRKALIRQRLPNHYELLKHVRARSDIGEDAPAMEERAPSAAS